MRLKNDAAPQPVRDHLRRIARRLPAGPNLADIWEIDVPCFIGKKVTGEIVRPHHGDAENFLRPNAVGYLAARGRERIKLRDLNLGREANRTICSSAARCSQRGNQKPKMLHHN